MPVNVPVQQATHDGRPFLTLRRPVFGEQGRSRPRGGRLNPVQVRGRLATRKMWVVDGYLDRAEPPMFEIIAGGLAPDPLAAPFELVRGRPSAAPALPVLASACRAMEGCWHPLVLYSLRLRNVTASKPSPPSAKDRGGAVGSGKRLRVAAFERSCRCVRPREP